MSSSPKSSSSSDGKPKPSAGGENEDAPVPFDQLGENDILLGRGSPLVKFEGNVKFRQLIREHRNVYLECTQHSDKDNVAKEVLNIVKKRGGKFWKRVEGSENLWVPVDFSTSLEKVKQAMRDLGVKRKAEDGMKASERKRKTLAPQGGEMSQFVGGTNQEMMQHAFLPSSAAQQEAMFQSRLASLMSQGSLQNQLSMFNMQRAQEAERQLAMLEVQAQQRRNLALQAACYPSSSHQSPALQVEQLIAAQRLEQQLIAQQALRSALPAGPGSSIQFPLSGLGSAGGYGYNAPPSGQTQQTNVQSQTAGVKAEEGDEDERLVAARRG